MHQPPAESPQKPCNPPRFVHVFAVQKATFLRIRTQKIGPKTESNPRITGNPPQLTTKPEDSCDPQAKWSDLYF
jgi:hypothetical protein